MLVGSRARTHLPERDERPALRDGHVTLTWRRLRELSTEIGEASRTWSDHIGPSARHIGLAGPSGAHLAAAFLGLACEGWAVGVFDPVWSSPEIVGAVGQLDPCAMLVDDAAVATRDALTGLGWVALWDISPSWQVWTPGTPADPRPVGDATPEDVFYVGFTSGSSGRPKAFARSHRSWWESFAGLQARCPMDPNGVVVVPGTLASSHFLFGAMHGLHTGAEVVLIPSIRDLRNVSGAVCGVYVVPSMLVEMCAGPFTPESVDVIFCAGARLDPPVVAMVTERLPAARLVEYYGASELSFVSIRVPGDGAPPGSVGRAFPGVEISIRDDDDRPLDEPGTVGTIFARSSLVFHGYRGEVEGPAARTIGDGWWTVGDTGSLDEREHLYVIGRGSGLIISGGANVQPEEVEHVVGECAGIRDCVCVGVPDARWGEVVCAVLILEAGAGISRADVRRHVGLRLAPYKRPRRYVALTGPLPLGRTGKVDRASVRDLVLSGAGVQEFR